MNASDEDPDLAALEETLRQAQRVIESHLARLERELRHNTQGMHLAVAGLAGMIAVVGLTLNLGATIDPLAAWGLSAGVLALCVALVWFTHGRASFAGPASDEVGPDVKTLVSAVGSDGWSRKSVLASALFAAPGHIATNQRAIGRLVRAHARGLLWLTLGLFLHIGAVAYIAGRAALG